MKTNRLLTVGTLTLLAVASCSTGSVSSSSAMDGSTTAPASPPVVFGNPTGNITQYPNGGLAAKIIEAAKANAALVKQYSWSSRTELLENGKVEDLRIDLVSCGPNGQLQRTVVNNQEAALPWGFLRKKIAEREREKVEKYLVGLRNLVDLYTQPSSGEILNFVSQAQISAPDANGLLKLSGTSVLVPGDMFSLWIDPATRQFRKIQLTTTFGQEMVEATATFRTLKSGLTHLQFAEVDVPAKGLKLQLHNFDYNSNN